MTAAGVRAALEEAVAALPRGLRDHVLRVVAEARRLARRHSIEEERAVVAALGHDLARAEAPSALLRGAEAAGHEVSAVERSQPILLHGLLSARLMAERFGVEDEEALAAARYHTTGRAGMSPLERLIYISDKIEPEKAGEDPMLAHARRLAHDSLEAAMRHLLEVQLSRAIERGWPLHPDTVAAWNDLALAEQ